MSNKKNIASADSLHGRARVIAAFERQHSAAIERFGRNLRALMKERNISQKALGRALGVAQSAVFGWLNGSLPRGPQTYQIAHFFGIRPDKLLTSEENFLTGSSDCGRIEVMRFDMPTLLNQVRMLTKARGKRAELARALDGISDSRVSEWLSGKSEPDGRNTLKLLKWVAEQASKQ